VSRLLLESWWLLLRCELVLRFRGFAALHELVRRQPTSIHSRPLSAAVEDLSRGADLACVFYFKHVMCLQRSAATTLLLRRHGWKAEMVIGAQILSFRSHAWVEVEGRIVNDKPYMTEIYRTIERC
jgi:Transglutaminase-like superfamily